MIFNPFYPTFTSMESLTPNEQELFSQPGIVQELIAAFDCIPVPSKSFKTNLAIASRIDTWLTDFTERPYKPTSEVRTIQDIWTKPIVDPRALKIDFCPF